MTTLTVRENEQLRKQATESMRRRFEERKPDPSLYEQSSDRAGEMIVRILVGARLAVPLIALLAALASAVRTVQTASEIYTASGSHPIGVAVAAIAFTLSVEGALFALALAQEGQRMRWRAEGRKRHVTSWATIKRGVQVRLGRAEPLRHDELPEHTGGLGVVMLIAFFFAVAANAYMGLRTLVETIGATNLQSFLVGLVDAPAQLQLTFLVDFAAVLFPPLMALKAGHLTARFAAERAEQTQAAKAQYVHDLAAWRAAWNDPLSTEEGQELLQEYINHKLLSKQARAATARAQGEQSQFPFGSTALVPEGEESIPTMPHVNGRGTGGGTRNENGNDSP